MTQDEQSADITGCPNCGEVVIYRGVGRRPVWCSTRCRNDAALRRLGARRGAIEVRVVEVARHRPEDKLPASDPLPPATSHRQGGTARDPRNSSPSPAQALRAIRNDPEAVGKLLAHLERRRTDGSLLAPDWLPVRNAIRLLAGALPLGIERRT